VRENNNAMRKPRDVLDVEKTPVGLKADLPQRRQVLKQFANTEIPVENCKLFSPMM
jgi:hypothetical protein